MAKDREAKDVQHGQGHCTGTVDGDRKHIQPVKIQEIVGVLTSSA